MIKNKKRLSDYATVARLCKAYLRSKGIKCAAQSKNFSMGDSVTITVYDLSPDKLNNIRLEFSKYQKGHYDSKFDIYEYSNTATGFPQTKFLHVINRYTLELKQRAWDFLRVTYLSDKIAIDADYAKSHLIEFPTGNVANTVRRLLSGDCPGLSDAFWNQQNKNTNDL